MGASYRSRIHHANAIQPMKQFLFTDLPAPDLRRICGRAGSARPDAMRRAVELMVGRTAAAWDLRGPAHSSMPPIEPSVDARSPWWRRDVPVFPAFPE
jgi:hypothetical protein